MRLFIISVRVQYTPRVGPFFLFSTEALRRVLPRGIMYRSRPPLRARKKQSSAVRSRHVGRGPTTPTPNSNNSSSKPPKNHAIGDVSISNLHQAVADISRTFKSDFSFYFLKWRGKRKRKGKAPRREMLLGALCSALRSRSLLVS